MTNMYHPKFFMDFYDLGLDKRTRPDLVYFLNFTLHLIYGSK